VSATVLRDFNFRDSVGFGSDEKTSQGIFEPFLDAGGNFIDTANDYTSGQSERWVGKFVAARNLRDRVVVDTKCTFNNESGNPNAGGNGRKNLYRAIEGSLRRLKMDYVDLYYVHVWDVVTPVEEMTSTLNDLVREGKIRYYGFSDTPAWYVARAQTLVEKEGKERIVALQLEYSLIERNIEREHIPAAQQLGIAICPWSPLGGGFLTGKCARKGNSWQGNGRLHAMRATENPFLRQFTDRNWGLLDAVGEVGKQLNKTPAQVAMNWVATQPGVTSTILGATKLSQLEDNLGALEFKIPAELRKRLTEAGTLEAVHPYTFYGPTLQSRVSGGVFVQAWAPAQVYERSIDSTAFLKFPGHKQHGRAHQRYDRRK
jgi:aryl-alcohol dehydrogenase-like predicted oxidoreductase